MYISEIINKLFLGSKSTFQGKILIEEETGQDYHVELMIGNFVLKLEKYFREIYATLINKSDLNNEINLFNLLEYLHRNSSGSVKSKYFREEVSVEESIRKQLEHIHQAIIQNFDRIESFYNETEYHRNLMDFDNYWRLKHPEFYNS